MKVLVLVLTLLSLGETKPFVPFLPHIDGLPGGVWIDPYLPIVLRGKHTEGKNYTRISVETKGHLEQTAAPSEEEAKSYITFLDQVFCQYGNSQMTARWNYITNITQHNEEDMNTARLEFQKMAKEASSNITGFEWDTYSDPDLARQAKFYFALGTNITEQMLMEMNYLSTVMESTYSTAKICPFLEQGPDCVPSWELEPDLTEIIAKSRDYEELSYVWSEWRKASGNKYRQEYLDFIDINQAAAQSLGFNNLQDQWLTRYESDDFPGLISEVWSGEFEIGGKTRSLESFYKQLHAYVRNKLAGVYNPQGAGIKGNGYIPANVLGNMWAQSWENIEDIVKPFNDTTILDVTDQMVEQGYSVEQMYRLSETFFTTLGFEPMTDTFWKLSMMSKPEDREVVCHASAEDFFEDEDFRIKMCTTISHADLVTVHHEMGHIVYFMQYSDQPYIYREAANPGFHEAIGDTMALAVNTPGHLQWIGLLPESNSKTDTVLVDGQEVSKDDLGYLFHVALEKLAFLPFAYVMDSWRWGLFSGNITPDNLNTEWWKLRQDIQGVTPPVATSEEDFHPGSKYHIPANVPYIRYFVSFIVQFQFYEALCARSGQFVEDDPSLPLYLCDFSLGGEDTGDLIRNVMAGGFSDPWQQAIDDLTGTPEMTAASFIKYFSPLYDYLEQENAAAGLCVGWGADCESQALEQIEAYGEETRAMLEFSSQKAWEYYTSISDESQAANDEASEQEAAFQKKKWLEVFTQFDYDKFENAELRRRYEAHSTLGKAAMEEADFSELNSLISGMVSTYGAGKICPFTKQDCDLEKEGLTLEPGVEEILADTENRSWEELEYVWEAWRNATGRKFRGKIGRYVELSNKAAEANGLADNGELWLNGYTKDLESDQDFRADLETLWEQLKPLYLNVHAFVRWRYRQHWGEEKMPEPSAPIPAHLFGNMWGQAWQNTFKMVSPFPEEPSPFDEVDRNLLAQNYTVRRIFELSNSFYKDLGLADMEMCYDTPCENEDTPENRECVHNNPMIEKPDWDVVCHASAWDMYKPGNDDFRIKMCTEVNLDDLITIHHEMGHIQYDIQYKNKPMEFRDGANPGFHEAIGDTMALSVNTPRHLQQVGLLDSVSDSLEADINFLLTAAMERVVFLPFAYTIDQFRWGLFNKSIPIERMNEVWWELREHYQGIKAPVARSEMDFDAGAKYHVAGDVGYIRYFVAHILEYQFYRQMCLDSGNFVPGDPTKPLHKCDFSQGPDSEAAGQRLQKLLATGASKPWPEILEEMTGDKKMSAGAILDYFAPLASWLEEQIEENEIPVGW